MSNIASSPCSADPGKNHKGLVPETTQETVGTDLNPTADQLLPQWSQRGRREATFIHLVTGWKAMLPFQSAYSQASRVAHRAAWLHVHEIGGLIPMVAEAPRQRYRDPSVDPSLEALSRLS